MCAFVTQSIKDYLLIYLLTFYLYIPGKLVMKPVVAGQRQQSAHTQRHDEEDLHRRIFPHLPPQHRYINSTWNRRLTVGGAHTTTPFPLLLPFLLALLSIFAPPVECRSLAGELSLSCARPAADEWPSLWINCPLQIQLFFIEHWHTQRFTSNGNIN